MNETFRVVMSEIVLPLLTVALVVAVIVVVTNYLWLSRDRAEAKRAQGYVNQMQERQPKVFGFEPCQSCGERCVGYDMTIPGQEQRIHWQHVTAPGVQHHPMVSVTPSVEDKGRAGY